MNLGVRGKDLRAFMLVARELKLIILIRQTNENSLEYVGREGFYPKPAQVKAKTADRNTGTSHVMAKHAILRGNYKVGGLVVVPALQPSAFRRDKAAKAHYFWNETMKVFAPRFVGRVIDSKRTDTFQLFGVERQAEGARWRWCVDVDPDSPYFGALKIGGAGVPMSYVHGDYDLKDVIVLGKETDNRSNEGRIDTVKNFTPVLEGLTFEHVQNRINQAMGTPMVQHGAEAQFAWHGDEAIVVVYPDWRHETLGNAEAVQRWYENMGRKVLAQTGTDYLSTRARMFHFGPQGLFRPGRLPDGVKL